MDYSNNSDFDHQSTDSYSETSSVVEKSSSGSVSIPVSNNSSRSQTQIVSRLKNEVVLLREALDQINGQDVTLLMSKLRGSKEDVVNLKKRNYELKDRIQSLETQLFEALSIQTKQVNGSTGKTNRLKQNNNSASSSSSDSSDAHTNTDTASTGNYSNLERKYKSLEAVNQSLEAKMMELTAKQQQQFLNDKISRKLGNVTISSSSSATSRSSSSSSTRVSQFLDDVGVTVDSDKIDILERILSSLSKEQFSHISYVWKYTIQVTKDIDKKTMYELSKEVERLSAFEPMIDTIADDSSNRYLHTNPVDNRSNSSIDNKSTNSYSSSNASSSTIKSGTTTQQQQQDTKIKNGQVYSITHMLNSFILGVVLMLLSIVLSSKLLGNKLNISI